MHRKTERLLFLWSDLGLKNRVYTIDEVIWTLRGKLTKWPGSYIDLVFYMSEGHAHPWKDISTGESVLAALRVFEHYHLLYTAPVLVQREASGRFVQLEVPHAYPDPHRTLQKMCKVSGRPP